MRIIFLSSALFFVTGFFLSSMLADEKRELLPPTTVDSVDLSRYVGKWYEIAKIPNRFQKKCARNVTATYRLLADGDIEVINRCIQADGKVEDITGVAKVVDRKTNSKLKVSFFRPLGISLFWGDYWIIGLGPDYEYALVGTPDRKYGWILARKPSLDPSQLDEIYHLLRRQGYQPDSFKMTPQDN